RQKLSRSRKVGMSWCLRQGVPMLHGGVRFVDGSYELHVLLCSTSDMCIRDWVLCKVYRDARALAYLPFEAITVRANMSASTLPISVLLKQQGPTYQRAR